MSRPGIARWLTLDKSLAVKVCEVVGSLLAIIYALLIASNTGFELLGFTILLISTFLFAAWAVMDRRWAFLSLQFFYAVSAVLGLVRFGS